MILLDTNGLLFGFRAETAKHAVALDWLSRQIDAEVQLLVPSMVACSFLRLATRQLGPLPPATLAAASAFLAAIATSIPREPAGLTSKTLELCQLHQLSGDGSVDAWIAAYAICLRVPLASFDRGFNKYRPELEWIEPS